MKRKFKGRVMIPIIENVVYSNLIFQVSSGNNYAQKIYEIYGKKKSASVISRQLDYLDKKEHFLTSEVKEDKSTFPMQKIRVYSVNWSKVIESFIDRLKEQRDRVFEQHKILQTNLPQIMGKRWEFLKYLDNQEFNTDLKKNSYLIFFLKDYFSRVIKYFPNYTLSDILGFLIFTGDLDFVYTTNMNINRIVHFLESQKEGWLPQDILGISEEKWKELDIARQDKMIKQNMENINKGLDKRQNPVYERVEKRTNEIVQKDKELVDITVLNKIFQCLRFEIYLQAPLNKSTETTAWYILEKHFSKEELDKIRQFDFISKTPKQKTTQETNDFKGTKPEKNKENLSRHSNQNETTATIKGEHTK